MSSNSHSHSHEHEHTPGNAHGHSHSHDYGSQFIDPTGRIPMVDTQGLTQAERSRIHFDNFAKAHVDKFAEGRRFIAKNIQDRLDWIGVDFTKPVRVLDYACGTGVVSHSLAPYVTPTSQFVGIDVSDTLGADQYNITSAALGFTPEFMKAYKGTLLEPTDPNPTEFSASEFFNFDIVACSMSLHHFDDPAYAMQQLAKRARPNGGVFIIIDNTEAPVNTEIHKIHQQATGHGPHTAMGYAEEEMRKYFEGAGVAVEFEYVVLEGGPEIDIEGYKWHMQIFISKGKRDE
ncbi:S-adenosyl-L-methionine-dependent methyltransferase [Terfezia boudieri ATCC MYA-4762]|uniref:S-adenosyl-L-methionine-dependent methyltransferase n=1 Tax=Terfezia boudieri ATCC MYA-4762 TaxID=1051890 RepID=A0A3N4LVG0_9PEZI|nr:S-adenosyl-L-methionine-dependent methyltransferase [Terfezia boudieri ATCC MYA-4762]